MCFGRIHKYKIHLIYYSLNRKESLGKVDIAKLLEETKGKSRIEIKEMMEEAYSNSAADVSYMDKYKKEQIESVDKIESEVLEGVTQAEGKIKVPTVKSGEFNDWFNSLSVDELDSMWQNKSTRRAIERQLRAPGGMHEWHLVSRAPQFKNWGVNAEQIRDLRTAISDVEFINPVGKHGQLGSTTAHNELLGIIDSSIDYDMFTRRLNNWANYRS